MRNEKLIKAHLIYMDVMCLVHVVGIIWAGYASSEKVRQNNEEANFLSLPEKIALENKVISNIEASVTWTLVYIARMSLNLSKRLNNNSWMSLFPTFNRHEV
uniref:(northern house mosquito) hypothetical protein n=1 Tax=Culex pipiens TaxID=7175 RepID=A0A8D8A4R1_CULPI